MKIMPSRVVRIKPSSLIQRIIIFLLVLLVFSTTFIGLVLLRISYDLRSRASGMVPAAVIADISAYPIRVGPQPESRPTSGQSLIESIICLVLYPLVQLDSCKK